jgi:hypothetical protein
VSCDPLIFSTDILSIMSYGYVRNNPVHRVDQRGFLDDEAEAILNFYQEVADKIPQDEWLDLSRPAQGTRAHLVYEGFLSMGGDIPPDIDIFRMAAEVQVDEKGIIRAVGTTPGAARKGWRTIDAAVLKESALLMPGKGPSGIIGVPAADVIEVAVDYKTGNAAMQKVKHMESLIDAPYVKVQQGGNLLETAEKKLVKMGKSSIESGGKVVTESAKIHDKTASQGPNRKTSKFDAKSSRDVEKSVGKKFWKGLKFASRFIPAVGGIIVYATAEDALAAETHIEAVAGEIPIGPGGLLDLGTLIEWFPEACRGQTWIRQAHESAGLKYTPWDFKPMP